MPKDTEAEEAVALANRVLDDAGRDPDGEMCVLARQLLRARSAALAALAAELEREVQDLVRETWAYDPETGVHETSNRAAEEWVADREELIERIRARAAT